MQTGWSAISAPVLPIPSTGIVEFNHELLEVLPLGSGGEVGRSCIILSFKGRKVMLDCGNHPAKTGLDSLPFFDSINCEEIDLVLITHFHLDHCGALPYFCEQTNFKGRVFMTSATKAFYKMLMNDFIRVGGGAHDIVTSEWLHSTIERIETIEYHQEISHSGIKFQAFNAGHVLGAAMFMVDIAGVKTLYTGDYSRVPDRHLLGAELPPVVPDVLIVESTFGIRHHEPREEREERFKTWVSDVVRRGGRCLVPVFALGRAQELLLILEEHWESHPELQHAPIYYASSMATRSMKMYQTFVSAMNDRVREQHANNRNPFCFKYIHSLHDLASFEDSGPCVVLASPGMLQNGISLELFERWCGEKQNGVIIAGYAIDGTIAKQVQSKPKQVTKPDGKILKIRMETIETTSFCAHADGRQTKEFIHLLQGLQNVILVHGNADVTENLRNDLAQSFKSRGLKVFASQNKSKISIPFSVQRTAKVLGKLASGGEPHDGDFVSGVLLVSDQHSHTIVHPQDLTTFTGLDVTNLRQAMILPLPAYKSATEVLTLLQTYFSESDMFREVEPSIVSNDGGIEKQERILVAANVFVTLQQSQSSHTTLTVTWSSSRLSDLIADVTTIALIQFLSNATSVLADANESSVLPVDVSGNDRLFRIKCFHHMMSQFYSTVKTDLTTGRCVVVLENSQSVVINDCIEIEDQGDEKDHASVAGIDRLKSTLKRIYLTLFPIPIEYGWCECGQQA